MLRAGEEDVTDERLLSQLWRAQRFDRTGLRTTRGESLEVVYRGRPQRAPGPDYRDALLLLGGDLRHGDVEVHVVSSDWRAHGHDRDRRYDRVILHVVYREDPAYTTRTARGAEVPCLALDGRLPARDEPAGPPSACAGATAQPGVGSGACRARAASLDDAALGRRLDQLGDLRLLRKAAGFDADLEQAEPEQVFYERLAEALGYSQNRQPCLDLARRLPVARLYALAHRRSPAERVALCQALLFGVAGLLPSQRRSGAALDWASAEQAEEMERAWEALGDEWQSEVMGESRWALGVRPLNSPPRRLAALGHFLATHLDADLYQTMLRRLRAPDGATSVRQLVGLLAIDAPESYWASYFDFGRPIGSLSASLVGRERALAVAVNVCLPLALARGLASGDTPVVEAVWAAYHAAPKLVGDEVTRRVVEEALGGERARLVTSARRQQGLHHLYRTACDQARCESCPLLSGEG